jgi:hypothetical protein
VDGRACGRQPRLHAAVVALAAPGVARRDGDHAEPRRWLHAGQRRELRTGLGNALKDVARRSKADVGLQVAAVDYGDWDMHADMGDVDGAGTPPHQPAPPRRVRDGPGTRSPTPLVTLTEFGRRVEENGFGGPSRIRSGRVADGRRRTAARCARGRDSPPRT